MTTLSTRASKAVERMMHDAHLRYQREALARAADASPKHNPHGLDCPEIRGVKRKRSKMELRVMSEAPQAHWFTGLRPNFWKAYYETLLYMTAP